jgi:phosphotransferase system enzyme I (PtsI)
MLGLVGRAPEERLEGIGVCQGVAIGSAFVVDDPRGRVVRVILPQADLQAEVARFRNAVEIASRKLQDTKARLHAALGEERAYILDAHILMLQDRTLDRQVEQFILDNRANAEWAVRAVTNRLLSVYEEVTDSYLRERGSDIQDVAHRIINALSGTQTRDLSELASDAIIVADDLLPSVTAELDTSRVLGFVTNVGGWTSHTSIIARSLSIPAVVGLRDVVGRVRSGETVIVDGGSGTVILRPAPETLRFYSDQRAREQQQVLFDIEERELPAQTTDGIEIKLRANVELLDEIDALQRANAAGIGLFRSEFLYSQAAANTPTEDEQYEVYKLLAETSGDDGAAIRTFDLGGDKLNLDGFKAERNPALGLRAIRLSLSVRALFETQLRAILRAGRHGRLKILLPMVSNLDELRWAKQTMSEVEKQLTAEIVGHAANVEIGVMVEVPAAVLQADVLARECDFFSLGTNDLTQYMLAVDRGNENVSTLFDPLHPSVLRAIKLVIDGAARAGIPVNVCGEMASNPAQMIVLLGLGLRDLSMTPSAIPLVKRVIRTLDIAGVEKIAERVMSFTTPAEVNSYVQEQASKYWSNFFPALSVS